jgi:hypothetical protein
VLVTASCNDTALLPVGAKFAITDVAVLKRMRAPRENVSPSPMLKEAKMFFAKVFINSKFVSVTELEPSVIIARSTTFKHMMVGDVVGELVGALDGVGARVGMRVGEVVGCFLSCPTPCPSTPKMEPSRTSAENKTMVAWLLICGECGGGGQTEICV